MASIVSQIEQELGLPSGGFAAAFGTEVRQIDAKIASVQADWDKQVQAHDAQILELVTMRQDAQRRADELLGKA